MSDAHGDDGIYSGAADLVVGAHRHPVRVRVKGHLNPFDGHYHWQGTVHDTPAEVKVGGKPVMLCIGDQHAAARLVEQTSGGHLMISGTGRPPFWQ